MAAMLITEEYTTLAPIVILPAVGDRIRIYTVHGEAAADATHEEQPLASWPLQASGWTISFPCEELDLADTTEALRAHPGFTARDLRAGADSTAESAVESGGAPARTADRRDALVVDLEELRRS
ncbi:hypothetical protein ACVGOW_01325 [Pseudonocardia saturnea]